MKIICQYCYSSNCHVIHVIDNHEIFRCLRCNLIQTKTKAKEAKIVNLDKYNNIYLEDYLKVRGPQLIKGYFEIIKEIEAIKSGSNILDVGCGVGLFLETVQKYSKNKWNLYGIDINKKSATLAKKRVKGIIVESSIENNKFENSYFDVITCFDVLEHSTNLNIDFEQIYRLLKPNGLLVIQFPNYDSFMRIFSGKDWDWWCIPDHTFHFTIGSIKKVLEDKGFKELSVKTVENSQIFVKNIQGHFRKSLIKMLNFNRVISKFLFIPLYIVWFFMNKLLRNNKYGGLIQILAIKQ